MTPRLRRALRRIDRHNSTCNDSAWPGPGIRFQWRQALPNGLGALAVPVVGLGWDGAWWRLRRAGCEPILHGRWWCWKNSPFCRSCNRRHIRLVSGYFTCHTNNNATSMERPHA